MGSRPESNHVDPEFTKVIEDDNRDTLASTQVEQPVSSVTTLPLEQTWPTQNEIASTSSSLSPEQISTLQYYQYYYPDYYQQLMAYYYNSGMVPGSASDSTASSTSPTSHNTALPSTNYAYPASSISTYQHAMPTMTNSGSPNVAPLSFSSSLPTSVAPAGGSRVGTEKAFRQMNHFFDYDAYLNEVNSNPDYRRPPKLTKHEIQILKQRKQDKKKKRLIEWLNHP